MFTSGSSGSASTLTGWLHLTTLLLRDLSISPGDKRKVNHLSLQVSLDDSWSSGPKVRYWKFSVNESCVESKDETLHLLL